MDGNFAVSTLYSYEARMNMPSSQCLLRLPRRPARQDWLRIPLFSEYVEGFDNNKAFEIYVTLHQSS